MKLIDDMYHLYKDQLVGDEEDAVIIVSGLLSELDRAHYMEWIREMSEYELYEMLGNYLVQKLKAKMVNEGLGQNDGDLPPSTTVH